MLVDPVMPAAPPTTCPPLGNSLMEGCAAKAALEPMLAISRAINLTEQRIGNNSACGPDDPLECRLPRFFDISETATQVEHKSLQTSRYILLMIVLRAQNRKTADSQNRFLVREPSWSVPVLVGLGLFPTRCDQVAFKLVLPDCHARERPVPFRL